MSQLTESILARSPSDHQLVPQVILPIYHSERFQALLQEDIPICFESRTVVQDLSWRICTSSISRSAYQEKPTSRVVYPLAPHEVVRRQTLLGRNRGGASPDHETVWMLMGYLARVEVGNIGIVARVPQRIEKRHYIAYYGSIEGCRPRLNLIRAESAHESLHDKLAGALQLVSEPFQKQD